MSEKGRDGRPRNQNIGRTVSDNAKKSAPPAGASGSAKSKLAGGMRRKPIRNASAGQQPPRKAGGAEFKQPAASSISQDRREPSKQHNAAKNGDGDRQKSQYDTNRQRGGQLPDSHLSDDKKPRSDVSGHKNAHDDTENPNKSDVKATDNASKSKGLSGLGASATGVDYSDKSLKDRLEHQAADAAMDATPFLGQANSARKVLKDVNQKKRDAGMDEGLSDKVEHASDKVVDKGIKGVKTAAGMKAGADAGMAAIMVAMMMKTVMMIKGMVGAAIGKIAGFIGGIVNAVSTFLSSALGIAAGVAKTVAIGITAITVGASGLMGYGFIGSVFKNGAADDSIAGCVATNTKVTDAGMDYDENIGEIGELRKDNATKLWLVYEALGGSKEQTAAVLGNLHHESSGLDPSAVETIYNEPFTMGPRKQKAESVDFQVRRIDAAYAARFPAIKHVGIGLAQWTNGRNRLLLSYAKKVDNNWYDFDTQVKFMLEGDEPFRQKQLVNFLKMDAVTVDKETERFMNTWIGLRSPNPSYGARAKYAKEYMFMLMDLTSDDIADFSGYADSILSDTNVSKSDGNAKAGAYQQDDGCGDKVKSHYRNGAVDGTGEVPVGLPLVPWTRETLPESMKEFAKNPEDAGLSWGHAGGWTTGIIPDQCAALSHSYFIQLYPDWNKKGRPTTRPFGNGKDVAFKWATHYREKTSSVPVAGAVFSDATTSVYGHTGIVQHVFANGDILINEQNVRGASGAGAGLRYSWSWRVVRKDSYMQKKYVFFKPANEEPQWGGEGMK